MQRQTGHVTAATGHQEPGREKSGGPETDLASHRLGKTTGGPPSSARPHGTHGSFRSPAFYLIGRDPGATLPPTVFLHGPTWRFLLFAGRRSYLVYVKRTARANTHRRHTVPRPWEGRGRRCAHAFIGTCDVIRRARKPSATRNRMWAGVLFQSPRKRRRGVGLPPAPSSGQRSLNWFLCSWPRASQIHKPE